MKLCGFIVCACCSANQSRMSIHHDKNYMYRYSFVVITRFEVGSYKGGNSFCDTYVISIVLTVQYYSMLYIYVIEFSHEIISVNYMMLCPHRI
jgi:hypothetical protein